MIAWVRRLVRRDPANAPKRGMSDRGMLLFPSTGEVIRAETVLREAGVNVTVKGPPPALRQGCDMVVEFPLVEELRVREVLENHRLVPLRVAVVEDHLLEPVSLFHVKELGDFLMVRAANMKVTVHRPSGRIVNVSGGGCPDVPYLAEVLVGRSLDDAPEPRSLGRTLCGYALQLAFTEARRRCRG
ncbi:hypothetical protein TDMWS_19150 [Thermodesulfomicrobium sp. WS]|jgi:hypothetical protein|nr:hypothetical protein TDMWS_19150 [Thermodesulfomicrobium sp. WS]